MYVPGTYAIYVVWGSELRGPVDELFKLTVWVKIPNG